MGILPTAVLGQSRLGIDISDSAGNVDWAQVRDAGQKSFVFIKATSGLLNDQKANLDANVAAIFRDAPELQVGAYHFAYPNFSVEHTGVAEASHFLSIATSYIGPGYLPPVLDIENAETGTIWNPSQHMSAEELVQWIKDWAGRVEAQTYVIPIIYTGNAYCQFLNGATNAHDLTRYPLWIWTHPSTPTGDAGYILPWSTWTFQQYKIDNDGATCLGVPGAVDLDSFNGDSNALLALKIHPGTVKFTGAGGGAIQPPINDQFQMQISSPGSQQVIIQASDELATWTDVATVGITNGTGIFTDTNTSAHTKRFYRAKP